MDLTELLGEAKKLNASDHHITVGVPPRACQRSADCDGKLPETDGG